MKSHGSGSLGLLDAPPMELQYRVLRGLDVSSLLEFRRVSHGATTLVNSLTEWKKVQSPAH